METVNKMGAVHKAIDLAEDHSVARPTINEHEAALKEEEDSNRDAFNGLWVQFSSGGKLVKKNNKESPPPPPYLASST